MLNENHTILALLVVLAAIRGTIYISIVPPWFAPDEPAHFEAIRFIGQEGLLPTQDAYRTTPMHPQMRASFETFRIWQLSGLAPPPTYHLLNESSGELFINYYPPTSTGGVIIAENYPLIYHYMMAPISTAVKSLSIIQQLYIMRLVSLLFVIVSVIVAWFFVQTIFPEYKVIAIAVPVFLIFLPMYIHVNTSVNSDTFATLITALYFFTLARIFKDKASIAKIIWATGLLLIAILTKPTTLFIVPTTVVAVIIYFMNHSKKWRFLLTSLLTMITLMVPLGSVILFHFSNGGRNIFSPSLSANNVDLNLNFFTPAAIAVYIHTLRFGFLSFWGLFGWANIPILFPWLRVLQGICLLIASGISIFLVKHVFNWKGGNNSLQPYQKKILIILLFSIIFALIGLYTPIIATQSVRWGPPSRYIFPALIPISLYLFLGFQQLFPTKIYHLALPIWVISLITFDTLTLGYVLIPHIYG